MNTYKKYCPNVFCAECTEEHEKGEIIIIETKYGNEHECEVYNLVASKNGLFYYSIIRADGYNVQERAKAKAEKYNTWKASAENKSNEAYRRSNSAVAGIPFGQPILCGHHSENKHRRAIERSRNAMDQTVEMSNKASEHEQKADYWESRANDINLSMPESVDYYAVQVEIKKKVHLYYKENPDKREHSYSLTYAKKELNEAEKKYQTAIKLWA